MINEREVGGGKRRRKKEMAEDLTQRIIGSTTHVIWCLHGSQFSFFLPPLPLLPPSSLLPSTPSSPLSVYPARIFVPSFSIIIRTLSPSGFCSTMHKEEAEEYKYDRPPLKRTKNGNRPKKENGIYLAYVTKFSLTFPIKVKIRRRKKSPHIEYSSGWWGLDYRCIRGIMR